MSPASVILSLPIFLFSIVVHECAHGLAALRQGDRTAKDAGRITLNPIPHIDLFGSILVPLFFLLAQGFRPTILIGWAKPVPVNPLNFRDVRRGELEVSLSGPISNLMLALAFALIYRMLPPLHGAAGPLVAVKFMLLYGMHINCLLAVFNLIPVPPLDGSHVLAALLPYDAAMRYRQISGYGMWILILILMFPPLRRVILEIPVILLRSFFELIAGSFFVL
ncbi:MAG: site-2 protease family protein [Candidatus Eiseniibacteriota bacterium]|nr:MAG: site-2 protease family protein [Candidatus Eisenbacteria bacterium]